MEPENYTIIIDMYNGLVTYHPLGTSPPDIHYEKIPPNAMIILFCKCKNKYGNQTSSLILDIKYPQIISEDKNAFVMSFHDKNKKIIDIDSNEIKTVSAFMNTCFITNNIKNGQQITFHTFFVEDHKFKITDTPDVFDTNNVFFAVPLIIPQNKSNRKFKLVNLFELINEHNLLDMGIDPVILSRLNTDIKQSIISFTQKNNESKKIFLEKSLNNKMPVVWQNCTIKYHSMSLTIHPILYVWLLGNNSIFFVNPTFSHKETNVFNLEKVLFKTNLDMFVIGEHIQFLMNLLHFSKLPDLNELLSINSDLVETLILLFQLSDYLGILSYRDFFGEILKLVDADSYKDISKSTLTGGTYLHKYLKYKKKYLELSKNIQ